MKKWIALMAAALALGLAGCGKSAAKPQLLETPYQDTQFQMGTVVTLRIYDRGKKAVLAQAFKRITTLALSLIHI